MTMSYDSEFLKGEFLKGLKTPDVLGWLDARKVPPPSFIEVLMTGPTYKHAVGYYDDKAKAWMVGDKAVALDTFPHWQWLPVPPFYE